MDKLELIQKIGNEICEGCSMDPDCGIDPTMCERIENALDWIESFLNGLKNKGETMGDKTDACIALPHWEACKSCANWTDDGCPIEIELELHHDYFILCTQYVEV